MLAIVTTLILIGQSGIAMADDINVKLEVSKQQEGLAQDWIPLPQVIFACRTTHIWYLSYYLEG